jgi:hypothetical protein
MKLSGQKNQCQACKEYFNSNLSFDMHRTGKHGVSRRCRTPDEMTAKGMSVNALGFWISESMPEELRKKQESTKA